MRDRDGGDIPLKGRFLIEQATGAIVETTVTVERRDYNAAIVVRYVRDPKLGLWVPSEMKETYRVPQLVGVIGGGNAGILARRGAVLEVPPVPGHHGGEERTEVTCRAPVTPPDAPSPCIVSGNRVFFEIRPQPSRPGGVPMRARRLRVVPWLACCAAFLLITSVAALPVPDIAAMVKRVEAANTTAAVDSYSDFLVRLQTRAETGAATSATGTAQPDLLETRTFIRTALSELLGAGACRRTDPSMPTATVE